MASVGSFLIILSFVGVIRISILHGWPYRLREEPFPDRPLALAMPVALVLGSLLLLVAASR